MCMLFAIISDQNPILASVLSCLMPSTIDFKAEVVICILLLSKWKLYSTLFYEQCPNVHMEKLIKLNATKALQITAELIKKCNFIVNNPDS